ncbi:MAG: MMPL family transporter [Streptosporangiaceae bacterium]
MLAIIGVATFLLLTRAFRSVLLAAKAVVFNLISLAAAYGVLTWVWQDGHGSTAIWGIPATGAITMWVPLMVFAFLFGLSMDYEVFILSRIREAYDASGDARHAVTEGLGRTGRLVTSAAAILISASCPCPPAPRPTSRSWPPDSAPASSSTRSSSAACWSRRWSPCSAAPTCGCPPRWPGCCTSPPPGSRPRPRPHQS